jgi:hypothetical protein
MVVADIFSGFIHWGLEKSCDSFCIFSIYLFFRFDTWGTINTPVFGRFIRSFREHHLDAYEMCNHDFIEVRELSS